MGCARPGAVAVLGDMLELGPESATLHRELGARGGRAAAGGRWSRVGRLARAIAAGARAAGLAARASLEAARPPAAAARGGARRPAPGDWILVKASRGHAPRARARTRCGDAGRSA